MSSYIMLAGLFQFVVKLLLLFGTNRLCGTSLSWIRSVVASLTYGIISVFCISGYIQGYHTVYWRFIIFFVVSLIAFGRKKGFLRKTAVFFILSMALDGICSGLENKNPWMLLAASLSICLMCFHVSYGAEDSINSVPVRLTYAGKSISLTALCDTGNDLRDPITGRPVLIIDANAAEKLTGLTREQLKKPADTLLTCGLPGARLIPYNTIGQTGALLLALRIQDVKIGEWRGSTLVAFAPEIINTFNGHQAITGGVI